MWRCNVLKILIIQVKIKKNTDAKNHTCSKFNLGFSNVSTCCNADSSCFNFMFRERPLNN